MNYKPATMRVPGPHDHPKSEKLLTIREVADALGLHYWQVQRAVRRGDIPCYRPFNSRPLLRLSEVLVFVEASRQGGVA